MGGHEQAADLTYLLRCPNQALHLIFAEPIGPRKAAAGDSEYESYRRAGLLQVTDGRANPLMD